MSRDALWVVLQKRYRAPGKLLQIFKALHRDTGGAVRAYGKVSKEFPIKNGVRQGDVYGVKVLYSQEAELVGSLKKMSSELSLQDLEYAESMALISDSMDLLEELMQAMEISCSEMVHHEVCADHPGCD